MIIKNGEMALLVSDTDRALDQATGVAVDSGGYIVQLQDVAARRLQICRAHDGHPVRSI